MPSLRIHRNGEHLCTAGSDDVWTFTASLWGDVFGPEAAVLDVTGSSAPADGRGNFFVWECPVALARGDVLEMFFEATNESSPAPVVLRRTCAVAGEAKPPWSIPPKETEIASLESRETLNTGIMFNVRIADRLIGVAPDAAREHVSLHCLWRQRRPDHIRVSLSKQSLREIIARVDGEELFTGDLPIGSRLVVAIAA